MKVKDTTIDHHNDHDFNYQEAKMLSNDNGTQEQELGDERASTLPELNDHVDTVKELLGMVVIASDMGKAVESIVAQDGDINKQRELLEQTEKLCDMFSLNQEYVQDVLYEIVFGHLKDKPHDGEQ